MAALNAGICTFLVLLLKVLAVSTAESDQYVIHYPIQPRLLSVSHDSINLLYSLRPSTSRSPEPDCQVQAQKRDSNEWTAVDSIQYDLKYTDIPIMLKVLANNLQPDSYYAFRARCFDFSKQEYTIFSPKSEYYQTTSTIPSAPSTPIINKSSLSSSSVELEWSAVGTNNGVAVKEFQVEYFASYEGQHWQRASLEGLTSNAVTYSENAIPKVVVTELKGYTYYQFRVRSVDANRDVSEWSFPSTKVRTLIQEGGLSKETSHQGFVDEYSLTALAAPYVTATLHDAISLRWAGGDSRSGYSLEMVEGDSELFQSVFHGDAATLSHTVTGLQPLTKYRFRVRPFASNAGGGDASLPVAASTVAVPLNQWQLLTPYPRSKLNGGDYSKLGFTLRDDLVQSERGDAAHGWISQPSPRVAHSTVDLFGDILLFGGFADGYPCDSSNKDTFASAPGIDSDRCRINQGVSSELWRYYRHLNRWHLVTPSETSPIPKRGLHTAVNIDQRMLVFGGTSRPTLDDDWRVAGGTEVALGAAQDETRDAAGRLLEFAVGDAESRSTTVTGSLEGAVLGDLWEVNPGQETVVTVEGGANVAVVEMQRSTSTVNVSGLGLCVADVDVEVSLSHGCTRELSLSLTGPQHQQLQRHERLRTAELFHHHGSTRDGSCNVNLEDTMFDDEAAASLHSCCHAPFKGRFRPVDSLARFKGVPVDGDWQLTVYDDVENGSSGEVVAWKLHFTLRSCTQEYKYSQLASGPPARQGHTALVVDGNMYVFGGFDVSNGQLKDLWRFKYTSSGSDDSLPGHGVWAELTAVDLVQNHLAGRQLLPTPFGVLLYGGYNVHLESAGYDHSVKLYDPVTATVKHVETSIEPSAPTARGLFGLCFYDKERVADGSVRPPSLYLHGGYDGSRYLNDLWRLEFHLMSHQDVDASGDLISRQRMEHHCLPRKTPSTANTLFSSTCGDAAALGGQVDDCSIKELLLRAWCSNSL